MAVLGVVPAEERATEGFGPGPDPRRVKPPRPPLSVGPIAPYSIPATSKPGDPLHVGSLVEYNSLLIPTHAITRVAPAALKGRANRRGL